MNSQPMKLRIVYFFLILLLALNFILDLKDIDNSLTFFIKNLIRVPLLYFVFFLFGEKYRPQKNIFYYWVGFTFLLTINLIFYAPQPTALLEFICMSLGAIFTYLISKYYLKNSPILVKSN